MAAAPADGVAEAGDLEDLGAGAAEAEELRGAGKKNCVWPESVNLVRDRAWESFRLRLKCFLQMEN